MWFGDFHALIFNDAECGSNVGTGYRWFLEDQDRIYGINGYWDTRDDNSLLFNQAGIGVESLGQIFDFRANGYTPAVNDAYQHQLGNAYFQDNRLFVPSTAALSGMDAEAGVNFPGVLSDLNEFFWRWLLLRFEPYDCSHRVASSCGGYVSRLCCCWRFGAGS